MAVAPDPAQGLPQIPAEQAPGIIDLILRVLSGAGIKNLSKSGVDLLEQGIDPKQFVNDPLVRAGAGAEAMGISPELILSLIKQPQQQQQQQAPQRPIQDIVASLSATQGPAGQGLVPGQLPQPQGAPGGLPQGGLPPPPRFPG